MTPIETKVFVVLIFAVLVVAVAAIVETINNRRDKRRRKEEDIQRVAKRVREEERRRTQRVKRIAHQDKIGDRMYWSLVEAWKKAGEPAGFEPWRIRHNFANSPEKDEGNYYIEVGGSRDPIDAKVWISIDLRKIGREVSFTGSAFIADGYREFSLADADGFIRLVLVDKLFHQIKSITA